MTESLNHLSAIADQYDGFILDLWGVIHDGSQLYPNAHDTLQALKANHKRVIFLSNAPRRIHKVISVLSTLGVSEDLYEGVMSSGEAAYRALSNQESGYGEYYYFIGPDRDSDVLNGLPYKRTYEIEQAHFLLNAGFGTEEQSMADFSNLLKEASARQLPMVCLNPDMEVVKITGERFPCAGVIAKSYVEIGGKVEWFGKPYPTVYEECFSLLKPLEPARILAVGDGLYTDILGANQAGIDSVLVTGGILQGSWKPSAGEPEPNYHISEFKW